MRIKPTFAAGVVVGLAAAIGVASMLANSPQQGEVSPVKAFSPRGTYYPNTEDLASNEMRIISCGTGMPNQRPAQAASCFLVELGNGDKFIFDIGTASADNLAALVIPQDYLNKIFLSHLHGDHFGDLGALYIGGLINGRTVPLHVYGPSGDRPERGTAHAVEGLKQMYTWDVAGRKGRFPPSGQEIIVHEFDFRGENHVVYEENGVTIRSWPAIHSLDGSVSYSLEWNGLKFVFSGDTYPNRWFREYAQNADVLIHEAMMPLPYMIEKMNFPVERALFVNTIIHTPPPMVGRVFSEMQPRMAIAFHFFTDFDVIQDMAVGVRSTYDGPLSLASDMQVWNVTKDEITWRSIVFDDYAWSPPPAKWPPPPVDNSIAESESDWILSGRLDYSDIVRQLYERANEQYGTSLQPPLGGN